MKIKLRHKIAFCLLRPIITVWARVSYGFRAKVRKGKPPYLILANHTSLLDPIWLTLSFKHPVYFVASDFIFDNSLGSRIMQYLVSPISITKAKLDVNAIRNMNSILKQNGAVAMFPTGNTTYSGTGMAINMATAKLVKMLKVPLLLYRMEGLYGVDPRWRNKLRRGKSTGEVVLELSPSEVASMSVEQLHELITTTLQPAKENMALSTYNCSARAEYLERVLYICPDCGKLATITTDKHIVKCTNCNYTMEYMPDLTLRLISGNNAMADVSEWFNYQLNQLKKMTAEDFSTSVATVSDSNVTLYTKGKCMQKQLLSNYNTMALYGDRITIGDTVILLSEIASLAVQNRNKLIINTNKLTYVLSGEDRCNMYKYMSLALQANVALKEKLGYELLEL